MLICVWENLVPSQFYCEPKTTLKANPKAKSFKTKKKKKLKEYFKKLIT